MQTSLRSHCLFFPIGGKYYREYVIYWAPQLEKAQPTLRNQKPLQGGGWAPQLEKAQPTLRNEKPLQAGARALQLEKAQPRQMLYCLSHQGIKR